MQPMTDELRDHWQKVYATKAPTEVSWYQPVPERSLALIRDTGVPPDAPLLDVGAGASTLVDQLLAAGYTDLTVLDISGSALATAQARLGAAAARVRWVEADITRFRPERRYALWHDRAVFHFLVEPDRRQRYLDTLGAALAPGGHLILATFGPQGPTRCSGLPVQRYSAAELDALLTPRYRLVRSEIEDHFTPAGQPQQFLYGWWQMIPPTPGPTP
jgi:SAM-dependent methyltransferase